MAAGAVKAHCTLRSHGVLALVAVVARLRCTQNLLHLHLAAAQALQGVLHAPFLGLQLLGVVHVAEVTAAAAAVVGAVAVLPMGGRGVYGGDFTEGGVFQHLHHEDVALLAANGAVDKHHLPIDAGDTQALGGIALDDGADGLIFCKRFSLFHSGSPVSNQ